MVRQASAPAMTPCFLGSSVEVLPGEPDESLAPFLEIVEGLAGRLELAVARRAGRKDHRVELLPPGGERLHGGIEARRFQHFDLGRAAVGERREAVASDRQADEQRHTTNGEERRELGIILVALVAAGDKGDTLAVIGIERGLCCLGRRRDGIVDDSDAADLEAVVRGINAFRPLPHRLEEHEIGGITVVNDSISTTPEATKAALNAYDGKRIALIAGGHERQQDYAELAELLAVRGVTLLVCLPVTGDRLATLAYRSAPEIEVLEAASLDAAMQALAARREKFDTVILSPGAPSYGQLEAPGKTFHNFEERGEAFVRLARRYLR